MSFKYVYDFYKNENSGFLCLFYFNHAISYIWDHLSSVDQLKTRRCASPPLLVRPARQQQKSLKSRSRK